jgi:hypothetical protein
MLYTFLSLVNLSHSLDTIIIDLHHDLGFLICVPMLEQWQTEEGIQVIDGWSFQVNIN